LGQVVQQALSPGEATPLLDQAALLVVLPLRVAGKAAQILELKMAEMAGQVAALATVVPPGRERQDREVMEAKISVVGLIMLVEVGVERERLAVREPQQQAAVVELD